MSTQWRKYRCDFNRVIDHTAEDGACSDDGCWLCRHVGPQGQRPCSNALCWTCIAFKKEQFDRALAASEKALDVALRPRWAVQWWWLLVVFVLGELFAVVVW